MDIVDTQVHFNRVGSLEAGLAAMDAVGVAALLFDESWGYDEQHRPIPAYPVGAGFRPVGPLAEAAALQHPNRIGVLRRVDYRDPDLYALINLLAAAPFTAALRIVVVDEVSVTAFARGEYARLFASAAEFDLPVVALVPGRTDLLATYVEQFPSVRVIIDHCGAPMQRGGQAGSLDSVLKLARYPNVSLKWAHALHFYSSQLYPFVDVIPLLKRALAAFGPERVMWGSDFTVTAASFTWAETLFYIRDALDLSASDKEWVLGRAARTVLRWPAST